MPKTITLLRVFLASPNDVTIERNMVREVIDELNITYAINHIKLEVIGWETHSYPSIGEDAQDVINKQINDDYDIFIGIMWSRFGLPTKRDDSGTKEEFERAFQKYNSDKDSVSILLYFKNAPIAIDEIDTDQIKKIQEFKEDLKPKGIYYRHFTQSDEFEKLLRLNITMLLNKFLQTTNTNDNKVDTPTNKLDTIEENLQTEEEELGMFEYIDNAVQLIQDMQPILGKITKNIEDLGNKITKKTDKINLLATKPPDVKFREVRKVIDQIAVDMFNFNQRVRIEIPILNDYFSNAFKNYNNAITIFNSFNQDENEKNEILGSLVVLKDGLISGINGMESMKGAILVTPAMTSKYAKAKKETSKVLTEITEEFNSYINIIEELIKNINNS